MKSIWTLRITDHNYAQYIYCGKDKKRTRPAFTPEEIETIRKAVGIYDYADYVYCMIYLGYRPTEMLMLTIFSYNSSSNGFVGGIKTAAGKDRFVPISHKIDHIIKNRLSSANPYIFSMPDGKSQMTEEYFRERCFKPLMVKLGIENSTPYSCRHSFANLLKNVIGADTDKAALMGHADASMTKEYQSADYTSLRNIIDEI